MDIKEEGVLCKKDVQAKEDILIKGKYFCVESPLCLHEAGKEGYLKQKKGEASVWLEWKSKMSTCKGMKIVKGRRKWKQLLLSWNPAKSPRGG